MSYGIENIKKLSEKEKVRLNAAMYVGNLEKAHNHLVYEILSNSIDEFLAGYCTEIDITINSDNSITLRDNGRGIPVGYNPEGVSTIEEIFTIVHMGGKFDREGYEYSGGKHGVGTTVTNYLSEFLDITVKRDGYSYNLRYEDGDLVTKTHIVEKTSETGTTITFKPSTNYLPFTGWNYSTLSNILKRQHFLTKNLKYTIRYFDENNNLLNEDIYFNNKGLIGYIDYVTTDEAIKTISKVININDKIITYLNPKTNKEEKLKLSIAFQYTNQNKTQIVGYTNNILQSEGGTHIQGLKDLIVLAVKNACETASIKISKDTIKDDFLNGIVGIISLNLSTPEFEGQTKGKLGNAFVQKLIQNELCEEVEHLLLQDLSNLQKIGEHIKMNTTTRKAIENIESAVLKKVKDPVFDPDCKLADAESKDRSKCELFIVEGDSAGGGIEEMRNSQFEAVYKLKGKPLNSILTDVQKILDNKELKNLIYAIGTGIGKNFDITKLRYSKIFFLSDADSDGGHIQTLLLGFFKKLMPQLFINKVIYRIIPPLYGITTSKGKKIYLKDKKSLAEFKIKHADEKYTVIRFKGLGEMEPSDLYETCINPNNRIVERILDTNEVENEEFINSILGSEGSFKYDFLRTYQISEDIEKKKKIDKQIEDVAKETMYDYGMYVNQDRAIPNLEDGLKPVHRRLLFTMNQLGIKSSGKTTKSARIIGDTIGKYHPHGDISVYGASVKLTQEFYMKNPLIIKQGNFGSLFGMNNYAAARYTEMKLSSFSEDILLQNLSEKTPIVPFKTNYDGTLMEPEYFPATLPMVLLIPSFGIGFGISCDLPPHNLNEVIDSVIGCIRDKEKFDPLKYIHGPDFPVLDNEIINSEEEIRKIYETGSGNFKYRAKVEFDEKENKVYIKTLPYGVEFDTIYKKLLELSKGEKRKTDGKKERVEILPFNKSLKTEIKKIENFSGKAGKKNGQLINITITLNKNVNPEIFKAKLYKLTDMERTISFRPILLNRFRRLKQYNLKEIISEFLVFRREVLTRQFNYKIDTLTKQKYINEVKIKVFNNIDFVVKTIRESSSDEIAKQLIKTKLEITDEGAEYILDLKLRQIKQIDKTQTLEKINELTLEINKYLTLLQVDTMNEYIIEELKGLKKKYNQKRVTKIIGKQEIINLDSGINTYEDKEVTVFISPTGLIYKVSGRDIKVQNRKEDFISQYGLERELKCNNKDKIYIIQEGKGYSFNIGEIKEESAKPMNIYNEKIQIGKVNEVIFSSSDSDKDLFLFFDDGNVSRITIKDIIKSTQGYIFSTKKIVKYYIPLITSEELKINAKKYCYLRVTDEGLIVKHGIEQINLKKSIGTGISLRGKTLFFEVLEDGQEYYINNSNEKLDLTLLKLKTREGKGSKFFGTLKSLTLVTKIQNISSLTNKSILNE